jgi:hypothetical protein
MGMSQQELDQFIGTIIPEAVRGAVLALQKESHGGLRSVTLYRVVKRLVASIISPELPDHWSVWSRVCDAVLAAVSQAEDMTYIRVT